MFESGRLAWIKLRSAPTLSLVSEFFVILCPQNYGFKAKKLKKYSCKILDPGEHSEKVLRSAEASIRSRYKIFELTLQVEPFVDSMDSCDQCICP